jgi:hypothetical protein
MAVKSAPFAHHTEGPLSKEVSALDIENEN